MSDAMKSIQDVKKKKWENVGKDSTRKSLESQYFLNSKSDYFVSLEYLYSESKTEMYFSKVA